MKIKKAFLAILAVLTLFAASASTSISSFTSVEANAATHHKNVKKHKKAKKATKKHKKTTKKSKKKATKKHSKKKVVKKHKKVAKKKVVKKVAKKVNKKHVVKKHAVTKITNSYPSIQINPTGYKEITAQYSNKQYKAFNNVMISDHQNDGDDAYRIVLKGITYYNLVNSGDYKTAMTLSLQVYNDNNNEEYFFSSYDFDTYISSNNVNKKLYPTWENYGADIPGNSQQPTDITFVGTDDSTPSDFSSFTFNYTPNSDDDQPISINLNF